jgi:hypothetical protein
MDLAAIKELVKTAYTHLFPLLLPIPATLINKALAKAIVDEKQLKLLELEFSPRFITLHLGVQLRYLYVQFKVKFALASFEISSQKQEVVLRRVDDIELSSGGGFSRFLFGFVKRVIQLVTGKTLIEIGLKEVDIIQIKNDLLILNFKEAQIMERLKEALTEKLSPLASTVVSTLISQLLLLIGKHFAITDLKSNSKGLVLQIIRLHPNSSTDLELAAFASEL